jgi:hypothetical protein
MTTLAAICLNEEEFIEAWLRFHYDSFDRIILCEGAYRNYPREAVTEDGLSLVPRRLETPSSTFGFFTSPTR